MTNNSRYLDSEGLRYFWTKILNSINTAVGANYTGTSPIHVDTSTHVVSMITLSGVTAGSYGPSGAVTGNDGITLNVPNITVDSHGVITSISNKVYTSKNTTYTEGAGIQINNNAIALRFNTLGGQSYAGEVYTVYNQMYGELGQDLYLATRIPIATASLVGLIKVGNGLGITNEGSLYANYASFDFGDGIEYTQLDGIHVIAGDGLQIDGDTGAIEVKTPSNSGILVGSNGVELNISSGALTGNEIPLKKDSNGALKVGIPNASANGVAGGTTNTTGLMTSTHVTRLYNTYTISEVDNLVAAIKQFEAVVSSNLPTASANTMQKIYLVPSYSYEYSVSDGRFVASNNESFAYFYPGMKFEVPAQGIITISSPDLYDGSTGWEFKPLVASGTTEDISASQQASDWSNLTSGSSTYVQYKNNTNASKTVYVGFYDNSGTTPAPAYYTSSISVYIATAQGANIKNEWITVDNGSSASTQYTWELIGTTEVNIERITNSEIDSICQ